MFSSELDRDRELMNGEVDGSVGTSVTNMKGFFINEI